MVYVKSFDILGIATAQIPCIELHGAPNSATAGAVGLLGMDVDSEGREVYVCTAVNGAIYTWQSLRDGRDGVSVIRAETINDDLILTLSNGTTLNAGRVRGPKGDDGMPGVSVANVELNENCELVVTLSNGTVKNVGCVRGEKGATGAEILSTEYIGQDGHGGNIYKLTFDNGVTTTFTAPMGTVDNSYDKALIDKMFEICSDWDKAYTNAFQYYKGRTDIVVMPRISTGNVTGMSAMFYGCTLLVTVPAFDTSNVTNMQSMFYECTSLESVPTFDTSNVTDMGYMFWRCTSLKSVPTFDTSNVTNMHSMFYHCTSLESAPAFDTSKVRSMNRLFYECTSLKSVPAFDTSNVTDMGSMFGYCSSLESVPAFDTSKVESMGAMFYGCTSLKSVPAFDMSNVKSMGSMFSGCTSLKSVLMENIGYNLDISASTQFEASDLVVILNNLKTVYQTRTLTMGATNLAKLTDEQKAIATNKGWTLA